MPSCQGPGRPPNSERSGEVPAPDCLGGAVTAGFGLLTYAGGSVEELEACATKRHVTALYATHVGAFVAYILKRDRGRERRPAVPEPIRLARPREPRPRRA
ncbi:MAG: hypothetical protein OXC94_03870 [Chloroflexi bacterium]|nr:hypothetical protein [Chloroflexota bacterium]